MIRFKWLLLLFASVAVERAASLGLRGPLRVSNLRLLSSANLSATDLLSTKERLFEMAETMFDKQIEKDDDPYQHSSSIANVERELRPDRSTPSNTPKADKPPQIYHRPGDYFIKPEEDKSFVVSESRNTKDANKGRTKRNEMYAVKPEDIEQGDIVGPALVSPDIVSLLQLESTTNVLNPMNKDKKSFNLLRHQTAVVVLANASDVDGEDDHEEVDKNEDDHDRKKQGEDQKTIAKAIVPLPTPSRFMEKRTDQGLSNKDGLSARAKATAALAAQETAEAKQGLFLGSGVRAPPNAMQFVNTPFGRRMGFTPLAQLGESHRFAGLQANIQGQASAAAGVQMILPPTAQPPPAMIDSPPLPPGMMA
jgi:hypothetical protein